MECYNYAGWGCAPHAHYHPNYQNYYRYDYPTHHHHEHMHTEYSAYASKEARMRRALSRRDARHSPAQPIPLPHTPPLDHTVNGRGPAYCEPQMWSHYHQMGMGNGPWGGMAGWPNRSCFREYMRYPQLKNPYPHSQSPLYTPDGRCTPYNVYENYPVDNSLRPSATEYPAPAAGVETRVREQPARVPPEDKRPPVVPLPAFQQAFGSTEIGKFAEAFSRTEAALEDAAENFAFEAFPDWDAPPDTQYTQPAREIKCEDNY